MNDMTTAAAEITAESSLHNEPIPALHTKADPIRLAAEGFSDPDMPEIQQPEFWLGNGLP